MPKPRGAHGARKQDGAGGGQESPTFPSRAYRPPITLTHSQTQSGGRRPADGDARNSGAGGCSDRSRTLAPKARIWTESEFERFRLPKPATPPVCTCRRETSKETPQTSPIPAATRIELNVFLGAWAGEGRAMRPTQDQRLRPRQRRGRPAIQDAARVEGHRIRGSLAIRAPSVAGNLSTSCRTLDPGAATRLVVDKKCWSNFGEFSPTMANV